MTIAEALSKVDRLRPNQVSAADKLGWLSDCDAFLLESVVRTHGADADVPAEFAGYGAHTDQETSLLAGPPYDEMYLFYLYMQIDLVNMELGKYNNDRALYLARMGDYAAFYNRTHAPLHAADHFSL